MTNESQEMNESQETSGGVINDNQEATQDSNTQSGNNSVAPDQDTSKVSGENDKSDTAPVQVDSEQAVGDQKEATGSAETQAQRHEITVNKDEKITFSDINKVDSKLASALHRYYKAQGEDEDSAAFDIDNTDLRGVIAKVHEDPNIKTEVTLKGKGTEGVLDLTELVEKSDNLAKDRGVANFLRGLKNETSKEKDTNRPITLGNLYKEKDIIV